MTLFSGWGGCIIFVLILRAEMDTYAVHLSR